MFLRRLVISNQCQLQQNDSLKILHTDGSQSGVPAASDPLGNLLEMQRFRPQPRPIESETAERQKGIKWRGGR